MQEVQIQEAKELEGFKFNEIKTQRGTVFGRGQNSKAIDDSVLGFVLLVSDFEIRVLKAN